MIVTKNLTYCTHVPLWWCTNYNSSYFWFGGSVHFNSAMRVQFLFLSLMLDFSAASALGPVAEFDATKGITVNERNEVEKWRDIRNTGLWSMSALGNKPLLVTANGGRSHVHFSRNQHMVLNLTTPVYIDTGITGTTLVIVIKNEYKRGSHMIFGECYFGK